MRGDFSISNDLGAPTEASRDRDGVVSGRSVAGESGGGAYPNPHTGKKPRSGSFMGHGGQTNIGYHGGPQAGFHGSSAPNATTRGGDDFTGQGETGPKPAKE